VLKRVINPAHGGIKGFLRGLGALPVQLSRRGPYGVSPGVMVRDTASCGAVVALGMAPKRYERMKFQIASAKTIAIFRVRHKFLLFLVFGCCLSTTFREQMAVDWSRHVPFSLPLWRDELTNGVTENERFQQPALLRMAHRGVPPIP
jgi:hypothetical protein